MLPKAEQIFFGVSFGNYQVIISQKKLVNNFLSCLFENDNYFFLKKVISGYIFSTFPILQKPSFFKPLEISSKMI